MLRNDILARAVSLVMPDAEAVDAVHPYHDGVAVAALSGAFLYAPEVLRKERAYLAHEGHTHLVSRLCRVEEVIDMQTSAALAAQPCEYPNDPAYWGRTFDTSARKLGLL